MLSVFMLYRVPPDPSRAQAIQVIHASHALASRGHEVWLVVDGDDLVWGGGPLETYGLDAVEGLRLVRLRKNPLGSIQFRAAFLRWFGSGRGAKVAIARSKRHAREALRWCGHSVPLVVEAHEVDSLLAAERDEPAEAFRDLEQTVLRAARGVIANAPGTATLLRETWPDAVRSIRVIHNATSLERVRQPSAEGHGYVVMGSALPGKDLETVARAAARSDEPIHLIGPRSDRDAVLRRLSEGRLRLSPPLPHGDVPDRLAEARAVILPLGDGLFGEHMTSPLKLWDYLVCGRPVVAADTAAVRAVPARQIVRYPVGSDAGLLRALRAARDVPVPVAPHTRTWAERASEVEHYLLEVLP